jgi:hypothetical protein
LTRVAAGCKQAAVGTSFAPRGDIVGTLLILETPYRNMSILEPMRSPTIQSRHTQSTRTHRIEISDAPSLNRKQLAREFAAMMSRPPQGTTRITIHVGDELVYVLPQIAEAVAC